MTQITTIAMAAAISAALATSASAALIGVGGDGNDCGGQDDAFVVGSIDEPAVSGDFYSGDCSTTAAYGSSPWIIKYDEFEDSATAGQIFINQLFPTIDGSEFEITFSTDFNAGTWTYTPGPGDPVVTAVAAKGGSQYNFYFDADGFTSFDFAAPGSANLSHITFFDTDHSVVPLPAAGWLLVAGMGGLAAMRRRKG